VQENEYNKDAFFTAFHEAAKRVPRANPGDVGGLGLLACDEQDVAKAVGVEFGHGGEVGGEDFTVTGLQSGDQKIDRLFGASVDFF